LSGCHPFILFPRPTLNFEASKNMQKILPRIEGEGKKEEEKRKTLIEV
jgi:hypothetical protein